MAIIPISFLSHKGHMNNLLQFVCNWVIMLLKLISISMVLAVWSETEIYGSSNIRWVSEARDFKEVHGRGTSLFPSLSLNLTLAFVFGLTNPLDEMIFSWLQHPEMDFSRAKIAWRLHCKKKRPLIYNFGEKTSTLVLHEHHSGFFFQFLLVLFPRQFVLFLDHFSHKRSLKASLMQNHLVELDRSSCYSMWSCGNGSDKILRNYQRKTLFSLKLNL